MDRDLMRIYKGLKYGLKKNSKGGVSNGREKL